MVLDLSVCNNMTRKSLLHLEMIMNYAIVSLDDIKITVSAIKKATFHNYAEICKAFYMQEKNIYKYTSLF